MSKNKFSEVGAGEDLLRAIVQMGCAEVHAQTLYYKATSELENGIIDVSDQEAVQKQVAKLDMFREDIDHYADIRRMMMRSLFNMFDGEEKDKNMWCQIKHLGVAAYTAFETYQASDQDPELLLIAYEANRAFVKAVTRWLGVEISDCAACLSDSLKGISEVEDDKEEE